MPTSNGQVSSRDIRQGAVKTVHVRDEAITTPKIPDLAVTFPDKIDNPTWSACFFEPLFANVSLTDGVSLDYSTTVDVPAWVDTVSVLATGFLQWDNSSGVNILGAVGVTIDGEGYGAGSHESATGFTACISRTTGANLIGVAGSSVEVGIQVFMQGATPTSNRGRIAGIMIGHR